MGRPLAFLLPPAEFVEMEARLQQLNNSIPSRVMLQTLAEKFSSPVRAGRIAIQPKQVRRLLCSFHHPAPACTYSLSSSRLSLHWWSVAEASPTNASPFWRY
ncbi:hypothetical protein EJB05_34828 [Eragrostis curvula]|uniref:Uncharacterized protein n=1 Tax=Eragrostis curvula TaxID=38414 RepID=A0A5J9U561_9POAL|nr:hypothetical protein EJB05_34828 [Eragrostis curvula]